MSSHTFTKMESLGNDFVVFETLSRPIAFDTETVRRLADRRRGVGCDQILVLGPPNGGGGDFSYRIWNADGNEVAQCGNGARCALLFLRHRGLIENESVSLETSAGLIQVETADGNMIRSELGVPEFEPAKIPLSQPERRDTYTTQSTAGELRFAALSLGNPHAVVEVDSVAAAPLAEFASAIAGMYPEGVNVGVFARAGADAIDLRVSERGVGETPACGSGACAAGIVAIRGGSSNPLSVRLSGGEITVGWDSPDGAVWAAGPASIVFDGEIELWQ